MASSGPSHCAIGTAAVEASTPNFHVLHDPSHPNPPLPNRPLALQVMCAATSELHYFPIRGRGEPIRLALSVAKVPFADVPVDRDEMKNNCDAFAVRAATCLRRPVSCLSVERPSWLPPASSPSALGSRTRMSTSPRVTPSCGTWVASTICTAATPPRPRTSMSVGTPAAKSHCLPGNPRRGSCPLAAVLDGVESLRQTYSKLIYVDGLSEEGRAKYIQARAARLANQCTPFRTVHDPLVRVIHAAVLSERWKERKKPATVLQTHVDPSTTNGRNNGAHFAYLAKLYKKNGSNGFIVGNKLSIADIQVRPEYAYTQTFRQTDWSLCVPNPQLFDLLDIHAKPSVAGAELAKWYPELIEYHGKVAAVPEIKARRWHGVSCETKLASIKRTAGPTFCRPTCPATGGRRRSTTTARARTRSV